MPLGLRPASSPWLCRFRWRAANNENNLVRMFSCGGPASSFGVCVLIGGRRWSENRFRASRVVGASGRVGARLTFGAHCDRALPLRRERAQNARLLDLFAEDDRLNVYAGELEVRPPGAPTPEPATAPLVRR